ncbi:MAG: low molecular weight phosphotyrosine protein phosphatase [Muribaculaceae bacterium]
MNIDPTPSRKREIPTAARDLAGKEKIKILFVCLGNICRSPAAEGVMRAMAEKQGVADRLDIDSAGLYGGHAGDLPDKRMRVHAFQRGYSLTHRSRPVKISDYDDFDLIVAMDDSNYDRLRGFAPTLEDRGKVVKMIDFVKGFPQCDCVPDPYYDGAEGFELVLDLLEDGCANMLLTLLPDNR